MIFKQLQEIQIFKNRFQTLFGHMPALIFSSNGRIQQMNDAAETALGLSRHELIGKTFFKARCRIIDESGRKLSLKDLPWNLARDKRIVLSNVVTGIILPNGKCQWQQSTSLPLLRQAGKSSKMVITILVDITRYKQSQAQFLQYQKMEAIGSLASGLAHDFNNILTSILSSSQLLLVDLKGSNLQDCEPLKDIEAEALRGAELAKQLLSFSRPSTSHGRCKLNECMNDLRRLLRRTLPKNISIEMEMNNTEMLIHMSPHPA
jgi:PAS domain S-box-containing protein